MDESLPVWEYKASWAGAQSEIGKIRRAEGDAMPARESGSKGAMGQWGNGPKLGPASTTRHEKTRHNARQDSKTRQDRTTATITATTGGDAEAKRSDDIPQRKAVRDG
ncbi:hypothetical protein DHEL01_v208555 [Diaporthe helianthi]|uniref:Uncharacterized protein n=1 Tax=Diaporthe helianthi TaxID=158607 RepID=A0A2P5HS78_DIAHE|nr:hypothetical protein DHEL01_v208555 [Diaporthe helianthi]